MSGSVLTISGGRLTNQGTGGIIPEPSSALLLAGGLAVTLRRRRS